MLSPTAVSFRAQYQALVSSGAIEPDTAQAEAADAFADLEQRLASYKPVRKQGLLGRLFADKNGGPPPGPLRPGEEGGGGDEPRVVVFLPNQVVAQRPAP